ncbi:olee1-like protein [Durio zibethinus]|uniref:Olee1-like protein n=1 Tax=Durio zibethinus TaxID=66656 RepID=A0A6P5X9D9_DURZI|nr:olee1-like protein [Durio zibethinus]
MATTPKAIFFLASALCFLPLLSIVHAEAPEHFFVEGKVYCDNCRAQFVTRISKYIAGAQVRLECKDRADGRLTYAVDGETDASGTYHLKVEGDHEEEICEVALVRSSDPECAEIDVQNYLRKSARIVLTKDTGICSDHRMANPLGFMVKQPLPECTEVLRELGITSTGLV